ncbi:MAG: alpha/beta hydrolase [Microbacteriaceae bacterium]|nr:alpha/beta hydrolase [Microbacteriaceae bacterium]
MTTAHSADGTEIRFDRSGSGEPLILVLGAFNERAAGEALAAYLTDHFTVVNYDRRGRGESGDTLPYDVEREVEDLGAVINTVGGGAAVVGYSSGAVLAMIAVDRGLPITKLALYEPPFPLDGMGPAFFTGLAENLREEVNRGRRGEAVELFQTRAVGIPPEVVAQIRQAPFWPALEEMAHTLEYEARILAIDSDLPARVGVPTVVVAGSASPPLLTNAATTLAGKLPQGTLRTLRGQTHDLVPESVGPVLIEFLES